MLIGRYGDTTGRPFMAAYVMIPRLGVSGLVSFLMDTGADQTVLMPSDVRRLGIAYDELDKATETFGVGGKSSDYTEPGACILQDDRVLHVYNVDFVLMRRRRALETFPSLLGRNVMDRWRVVFDRPTGTLTAEIANSDIQVPLATRSGVGQRNTLTSHYPNHVPAAAAASASIQSRNALIFGDRRRASA